MFRLLLVEDEKRCSVPTLIALRRHGYEVEWAENGKAALDWILANGEPDVILLDLYMPVMSGYQFLETYRGSAAVIVLSGWTDMGEEIPGTPVALVRKPFSTIDLKEKIELVARGKGGG